jgi:hypothetical protein
VVIGYARHDEATAMADLRLILFLTLLLHVEAASVSKKGRSQLLRIAQSEPGAHPQQLEHREAPHSWLVYFEWIETLATALIVPSRGLSLLSAKAMFMERNVSVSPHTGLSRGAHMRMVRRGPHEGNQEEETHTVDDEESDSGDATERASEHESATENGREAEAESRETSSDGEGDDLNEDDSVIDPAADHHPPPSAAHHPAETGEHHQEDSHDSTDQHGTGHGSGHKPGHTESLSLGLFLLGSVLCIMSVFYLVNSEQKGVRHGAFRVLNMTLSIFVAVLMYGGVRHALLASIHEGFCETRSNQMCSSGILAEVCITLGLFIFLFVGTHMLLFRVNKWQGDDNSGHHVAAWATVMGHLSAFAAMYGFADSLKVPAIQEYGVWGCLGVIIFAFITLVVLMHVMDRVMERVVEDESSDAGQMISAREAHWIERCEETDDDVFSLSISFLLVVLIRFSIRGRFMPYQAGQVGDVTQEDSWTLLAYVFLFLVLTTVGGALMMKYAGTYLKTIMDQAESRAKSPLVIRTCTLIQHVNSMTTAWLLLFWSEWQMYLQGWENTVIGGCILQAIILTLSSFCMVYVLVYFEDQMPTKLAKRALKSLELALGILVGFSWERAFDVAFEEVDHYLRHHQHVSRTLGSLEALTLTLLLIAIVGPAWRLYILPKALTVEDPFEKGLVKTATKSYESRSITGLTLDD